MDGLQTELAILKPKAKHHLELCFGCHRFGCHREACKANLLNPKCVGESHLRMSMVQSAQKLTLRSWDAMLLRSRADAPLRATSPAPRPAPAIHRCPVLHSPGLSKRSLFDKRYVKAVHFAVQGLCTIGIGYASLCIYNDYL